ncbi:Bifunctional solanapyrone synthase, partial [Pseudocercospora fuligena]
MLAILVTSICFFAGKILALQGSSNVTDTCDTLKSTFANNTLLPSDHGYANETQIPWSAAAWQQPACIFLPENAEQLSQAVRLFRRTSALFAMRGDAANIDSRGVLISSTNLNTLELSRDNQTMAVGPGMRWGDVYNHLNGTDLTVIGGRIGSVGVAGLLLGGGVAFYSYNIGLASSGDKIRAYECVLANGSIVLANATNQHSDLYWALKGGGNSFALVTRFDLKTFYGPTPLIAEASYGPGIRDAFLKSIIDFAAASDTDVDPYAAITPLARWEANYTSPKYLSTVIYNGTEVPPNTPLAAFTNETGTTFHAADGSNKMRPVPLATYGALTRAQFEPGGASFGMRQKFHVISAKATMEAIAIIHDTYFSALQCSGLANRVEGWLSDLAFNPMTKRSIETSVDAPYSHMPKEAALWPEFSVTWKHEKDDLEIDAFIERIDDEITRKLRAVNASLPFLYMNDADQGQNIFEGYGRESLRRLREIRGKYDPDRVFTDLMPGGYKVAHSWPCLSGGE